MVSRYNISVALQRILFVVALCLSLPVVSSELNVSINHVQVELGKPVELRIQSTQTTISLDNINLNALKNDFHIKNIGEVATTNKQQTLRVTLYPRTVGRLFIPELHFLKTSSQPVPLRVEPAIDPKDKSTIDVIYSVSTDTPWKKQQVLVKLELTSRSSVLVLQTPPADSMHSETFSLEKISAPVNGVSNKLFRHTTGWAVFPRQTGPRHIELPAIQLVRDGVTTHRFYPPLIQLNVKPLPIYIPATMPVGRLVFNASTPTDSAILTDTIHSVEFSLKGYGVAPSSLPSIATQLKSNESINFYPAIKKTIQSKTGQGVISEDRYSVSFKTAQQGFINYGEINLRYFDPDSGTIKSLKQSMGNSFSINRSILILLLILVAIAGYFLLARVYGWLISRWQCLSGYQKVLLSIPSMNNPEDIKQGLMKIAQAENWNDNLTLQQWSVYWSVNNTTSCPVNISTLEAVIYGQRNTEIERFRNNIKQLCLIRWPIFKLFITGK